MSGGLRHEDDDDKFLILPRPTVRDTRLSFRARGLLAFLADLPAGWDVNAPWLVKQGKEGREAVYSALSELRAAGYYRVEKRRAEGGRWVSGTAVSKTARPAWAAEYAEQEAARAARREVPEPVYDPPVATDSDGLAPPTDLREPVRREAVGREPGSREPVGLKEERGGITGKETPPPSEGPPAAEQIPLPVDAPAEPAKPKRRQRIPEDWTPSPELLAKAAAKCPGVDVEAQAQKFHAHHRAKGVPMLDWDLAFLSTWMGNCRPQTGRNGRTGPYRNPTTETDQGSARAMWESWGQPTGGTDR